MAHKFPQLSNDLCDLAANYRSSTPESRYALKCIRGANPDHPEPYAFELKWALNDGQFAKAREAFGNLVAHDKKQAFIPGALYEIYTKTARRKNTVGGITKATIARIQELEQYGLSAKHITRTSGISVKGMQTEHMYMFGLLLLEELKRGEQGPGVTP